MTVKRGAGMTAPSRMYSKSRLTTQRASQRDLPTDDHAPIKSYKRLTFCTLTF